MKNRDNEDVASSEPKTRRLDLMATKARTVGNDM